MTTRIGIIGLSASPAAWTSAAHIGPLRSQPSLSSKYTVTALATTKPSTAAVSAAKWGIAPEKAYSSAEAIAADPDVDLVVVGVKLPAHRDTALPALRAGKDVLVEWPLAFGEDVVQELLQAAKDGGGKTYMGLQARCSPTILKAKEIIDSGVLGRIISSDILGVDNILLYLPPIYDYEHDAKNGANLATITTGHTLDAQCFLLGEYAHLNAQINTAYPVITTPHHDSPVQRDAPDGITVFGQLDSGATASFRMFSTTSEAASSFTWLITGDKGSIKFEGKNINIQMLAPELSIHRGAGDQGKWEKVEVPPNMGYGQVGHVYDAIANGEKAKGCLVDFEGGALRHRMLDACFKSSRDGTRETYRR